MVIATYLISLLLSLCALFMTLVIWLSHSLEGYPAFIISHANRGHVRIPKTPVRADWLDDIGSNRDNPADGTRNPGRANGAGNRNKIAAL